MPFAFRKAAEFYKRCDWSSRKISNIWQRAEKDLWDVYKASPREIAKQELRKNLPTGILVLLYSKSRIAVKTRLENG